MKKDVRSVMIGLLVAFVAIAMCIGSMVILGSMITPAKQSTANTAATPQPAVLLFVPTDVSLVTVAVETLTPMPTITPLPTSSPTATPTPPSFAEWTQQWKLAGVTPSGATSYQTGQAQDRQQSLERQAIGTRFYFADTVGDVEKDGTVDVFFALGGLFDGFFDIRLAGFPASIYQGLSKGSPIEFEATVVKIHGGILGCHIVDVTDVRLILPTE